MMDETYLAHHGIKGQKWGVRRFQNPDGTLTAAGKGRREKGNNEYVLGGRMKKDTAKKIAIGMGIATATVLAVYGSNKFVESPKSSDLGKKIVAAYSKRDAAAMYKLRDKADLGTDFTNRTSITKNVRGNVKIPLKTALKTEYRYGKMSNDISNMKRKTKTFKFNITNFPYTSKAYTSHYTRRPNFKNVKELSLYRNNARTVIERDLQSRGYRHAFIPKEVLK